MRFVFTLLAIVFPTLMLFAQQDKTYQNHWAIRSSKSIEWDLKKDHNLPHQDNIEMSGKRVSAIVTYAIDTAKRVSIDRHVIFPQLRTLLKSTDPRWFVYRAYFKEDYGDEVLPEIVLNNEIYVPEKVAKVSINGTLVITHEPSKDGLAVERTFLPSPTERLFTESIKKERL